jgi:hypothetical protein
MRQMNDMADSETIITEAAARLIMTRVLVKTKDQPARTLLTATRRREKEYNQN